GRVAAEHAPVLGLEHADVVRPAVQGRAGARRVRRLIVPGEDEVTGHVRGGPPIELGRHLCRCRQAVVAVLEVLDYGPVAPDARRLDGCYGGVDGVEVAHRRRPNARIDVETD